MAMRVLRTKRAGLFLSIVTAIGLAVMANPAAAASVSSVTVQPESVSVAPAATVNPCTPPAFGTNYYTGAGRWLPSYPGGYAYQWDQGWLVVWERGTPYRVTYWDWCYV